MKYLILVFIAISLAACGSNPVINDKDLNQLSSLDDLKHLEYDISQVKPYKPEKVSEINLNLGIEYMKRGKMEIALNRLRKAIEKDKDYADAHSTIAILYERVGQIEDARNHYETAVKLQVYNATIQNNYGQFLCKHGTWEEANRAFLIALANPVYARPEVPATNAAICAMRHKHYDEAEAYLRKALTVNPNFSRALYQMALLNSETGRYNVAKEYFDRYIDDRPHNAQTLWLGIRIAHALRDSLTKARYARILRSEFPDAIEVQWLNKERYHK
ncbi:type IV pilus biogenesis/stability protein PilW [Candidatus Albibeggiatoa sp. nov. NOAA]|uniref:type IV pilus biogenesis/stability protein PilW n=1 Tax=Candidatus Albibeggiatoa sp. nov. NOAA TaxID=3162724 RepID=UPI0032F91C1B|nr:type IV pilus biogenesis/stability protein PilW [Thiotrichaceae bacterium]